MRRVAVVGVTVGVLVGGPLGSSAPAHDHRPPKTVLRSGDARQRGNLGTFCWSEEGGGQCVDTSGYGFPFGEDVGAGRRVRIRVRRDQKPENTHLHAWRHVDDEREPQGDGWGIPHRVKKRTWGDRTVYDIIFRAPNKGEHAYLSLDADFDVRPGKFGAGDANYNYHLRLR